MLLSSINGESKPQSLCLFVHPYYSPSLLVLCVVHEAILAKIDVYTDFSLSWQVQEWTVLLSNLDQNQAFLFA